jgi:hypothetical protein
MAGWPFARVATCVQRNRPDSGPTCRNDVRSSVPRYQVASGGIDHAASSASIATTAGTSPRSIALM